MSGALFGLRRRLTVGEPGVKTWEETVPCICGYAESKGRLRCTLCHNPQTMGRSGLLWIGEKFYKTPAEFNIESSALGISRRIAAVPRGFKLGETWVLLAHKKAVPVYETSGVLGELPGTETQTLAGFTPGVFRVFRPERIEKIITEEQAKNEEFMEGLAKRGLTPVIVSADDPDHQGSLWDKPEAEEAL